MLIISTISANLNFNWVKKIKILAHFIIPSYIAVPFQKGMPKRISRKSIRDTNPNKSDPKQGKKLIDQYLTE